MGKVIPINVGGRHAERSQSLKASATDYLAQELAEIIEDLDGHPGGKFLITIEADGYPPELLQRIKKLLES